MTSERAAVAYLRRSTATEANPGNDSREAQENAVKRLCGEAVTLYVDWGISGSGDGAKRPDYQRLKADIASGKVGSVCAYSLTRLGRNASELLAFVKLCNDHAVDVRTATDNVDTTTASGRMQLGVLAVFAEFELESGKERSMAAQVARKARHEAAGLSMPGTKPIYGRRHVTVDGLTRAEDDPSQPIAPILDAYREAGTIRGACQLLQERGVPAPGGGDVWGVSTLRRILDHYAAMGMVELPEVRARSGRRPVKATALFAGLLRCHCGRTMTPNVVRGQYYCAGGRDSGTGLHGQYSVTERALRPALESEADRYRRQTVVSHKAIVADQKAKDKLTARRERVTDSYLNGLINATRAKDETTAIDAQIAELDAQATRGLLLWQETIPTWDDVPAMNRHLRHLWRGVQLDTAMAPTVEWGIPGAMYSEEYDG